MFKLLAVKQSRKKILAHSINLNGLKLSIETSNKILSDLEELVK